MAVYLGLIHFPNLGRRHNVFRVRLVDQIGVKLADLLFLALYAKALESDQLLVDLCL
jgi:hypothetical protein